MREAPDRPISSRERLAFAGVLCVLFAVAAAATAGCAPPAAPAHAAMLAPTRTVAEQHRAAVKISTSCITAEDVGGGYGTGDVVGAHSVLTALHVVHCPGVSFMTVTVDVGDGVEHAAFLETVDSKADLALLRLADSLAAQYTPISLGPVPTFGDIVCEQTAVPLKVYRCETVEDRRAHVDGFDDSDGDVTTDGFLEFGNSGSSAYDRAGRLVGVMVMLSHCQGGFQCTGFMTSLADKPWVIPAS